MQIWQTISTVEAAAARTDDQPAAPPSFTTGQPINAYLDPQGRLLNADFTPEAG